MSWTFWDVCDLDWIINLLLIPQFNENGYLIAYNTKCTWVVTTPQGKQILLNRDTSFCNMMPYINANEDE